MNFGPASVQANGVIHGGYAFQEEYYAIKNEELEAPVVMPVFETEFEDFVLGVPHLTDISFQTRQS